MVHYKFKKEVVVLLLICSVLSLATISANTANAQTGVGVYLTQEPTKIDEDVDDNPKPQLPVTFDEVTKYAVLLIVCLAGLASAIYVASRKKTKR